MEKGDKEAIQELIDDIHSRHKKQLDSVSQELQHTKATLDSVRKINQEKSQREEQLLTQLEQSKYQADQWQAKVQTWLDEVLKSVHGGLQGLDMLNQLRETVEMEIATGQISSEAAELMVGTYMFSIEQLAQGYAVLLQDAMQLPYADIRRVPQDVLADLAAAADDAQ